MPAESGLAEIADSGGNTGFRRTSSPRYFPKSHPVFSDHIIPHGLSLPVEALFVLRWIKCFPIPRAGREAEKIGHLSNVVRFGSLKAAPTCPGFCRVFAW